MSDKEKNQIITIIDNIREQKGQICFFDDLKNHKVYGVFFNGVDKNKQEEISDLINQYIVNYISQLKTKGGQYFRRFFENEEKLFWKFRELNEKKSKQKGGNKDIGFQNEFQEIGKIIENKMFDLEGLLTQNMFNRSEGLGKVLDAFYKIVYSVFPYYNDIN